MDAVRAALATAAHVETTGALLDPLGSAALVPWRLSAPRASGARLLSFVRVVAGRQRLCELRLASLPMRFGGQRFYWRCPWCDGRTETLYMPRGTPAEFPRCRRCARLVYASQLPLPACAVTLGDLQDVFAVIRERPRPQPLTTEQTGRLAGTLLAALRADRAREAVQRRAPRQTLGDLLHRAGG